MIDHFYTRERLSNAMASTVWKGYISFGLISIPVRLYAAARDERVSFHQIHRVCGTRVKQQLYCPTCERVVERSEIAKGYPSDKDHFALIDDEDLKKIAPASSETMEIQQFVAAPEIDPVYFDASYYAAPEEPGRRAYQLLVEAMRNKQQVAIARIGMHQREYLAAIRPYQKGLMLHTLYYANEVRTVAEFNGSETVELNVKEVQMAEKLVEALSAPFNAAAFEDDYQKKVLELVESKTEGREVAGTPPKRRAPVIDMMEALQRSLSAARQPKHEAGELSKKPAAKAVQAQSAIAEAPKKRRAAH
ncbi:MAG: Ku protein [Bryobacteraceae bacterium]